ncbi:MAG: hypothetical protein J6T72_01570, partial [Alphaproteobacteria bacterium]|nr:hypothetical protein [Alphaproteobacteria bacterium]
MNWKILILFLAAFGVSAEVCAQEEGGIQSFMQKDNSLKRQEDSSNQIRPLNQFVEKSGRMAMKNIFEAEQVFCYEVFPTARGSNGYTLDGFPIRGFCGVLNKQVKDVITPFFFSNPEAVDFDKKEECAISPKLIMRFVRGIDFTDVMFSSPCNALIVFYAGRFNVYNYTPIAQKMDEIIKQMENLHEPFVSPALLNQLLPQGIVQNEQQRSLVNKAN